MQVTENHYITFPHCSVTLTGKIFRQINLCNNVDFMLFLTINFTENHKKTRFFSGNVPKTKLVSHSSCLRLVPTGLRPKDEVVRVTSSSWRRLELLSLHIVQFWKNQPQFLAVSQLGPQDIIFELCEKDTVQSCVKVASVCNTNFRQIKDSTQYWY